MRGKKADPEFVASFIQESVALGCETTEAIVQRAKVMIKDIDDKIKESEKLKITRSKVLDVILAFEKPNKDKREEAKLLSFFKLEYPKVCKHLCEQAKTAPLLTNSSTTLDSQAIFAIKQLLEAKILARIGNHLVRGDRFDDYMKFVIREVE